MNKRNWWIVFIAIFIGIMISIFSWQVRPMHWKWTFTEGYDYLPDYLRYHLDNPKSLRMVPVIVFIAFEAMFIYTVIAPISALLVLITIIPVLSIKFVSLYMNIYLHVIFLAAILVATISLWLIKGATHPFRLNCMDRWGALFLLYIWLLLPRTDYFKIGVKEVLSLTILFLTYFSVRFLIRNKVDILKICKRLSLIGGVVGVQAILHFYLMKKGFITPHEERFYRAYAGFANPTQLANFLIISLPLVGSFYFGKKKRIIWIVLSLIMTVALFLTFSRSAWVAIGLTLAGFILFKLKGLKRLIIIPLIIIIVTGFWVMSQDRYVVSDRLKPDIRLGSVYARKDLMLFSLSKVRQSPILGVGPGNFSYVNVKYDSRDMVNTSVPNTYLHTLTISGIIGFCIMSLFLLLVLRTGSFYINKGGPIFMGLYIGIVSNLVHACFENLFYNIISNWIFGLLLGLMITWQSYNENTKYETSIN